MNKIVLSGFAMGALITAGAAQAEPLTLADAQMEQVSAAGTFDLTLAAVKNLTQNITVTVTKTIAAATVLIGNIGDGEASANASGPSTLAETLTIANGNFQAGLSDSLSQSLAAASLTTVLTPPVPVP